MATSPSDKLSSIITHYNQRAVTYDNSWHPDLAADMISTAAPYLRRGASVLDLACGTGLLTFLAADLVGPEGRVIGVDISEGMLDVARSKKKTVYDDVVTFIKHDIEDVGSLLRDEAFQAATIGDGTRFDVIFCCSALPILRNPSRALALWAEHLLVLPSGPRSTEGDGEGGGKMICDCISEDTTLLGLFVYDVPKALRFKLPETERAEVKVDSDWREWMRGPSTLTDMVQYAGLKLVTLFKSQSYRPVKEYRSGEGGRMFDDAINPENGGMMTNSQLARPQVKDLARAVFVGVFEDVVVRNEGNVLRDGQWVYILVAEKT